MQLSHGDVVLAEISHPCGNSKCLVALIVYLSMLGGAQSFQTNAECKQ